MEFVEASLEATTERVDAGFENPVHSDGAEIDLPEHLGQVVKLFGGLGGVDCGEDFGVFGFFGGEPRVEEYPKSAVGEPELGSSRKGVRRGFERDRAQWTTRID